jgi:hypothetical protein
MFAARPSRRENRNGVQDNQVQNEPRVASGTETHEQPTISWHELTCYPSCRPRAQDQGENERENTGKSHIPDRLRKSRPHSGDVENSDNGRPKDIGEPSFKMPAGHDDYRLAEQGGIFILASDECDRTIKPMRCSRGSSGFARWNNTSPLAKCLPRRKPDLRSLGPKGTCPVTNQASGTTLELNRPTSSLTRASMTQTRHAMLSLIDYPQN